MKFIARWKFLIASFALNILNARLECLKKISDYFLIWKQSFIIVNLNIIIVTIIHELFIIIFIFGEICVPFINFLNFVIFLTREIFIFVRFIVICSLRLTWLWLRKTSWLILIIVIDKRTKKLTLFIVRVLIVLRRKRALRTIEIFELLKTICWE